MTTYRFLSEEWIAEAKTLRSRYEGTTPPPPVEVRMNVVVTAIPHRHDEVHGHVDSSSGQIVVEEGHLDDVDLTITVDYETARAVFIDRDPQAAMQAFVAGKILVVGDASKLLALQSTQATVPDDAEAAYRELRAITADDV